MWPKVIIISFIRPTESSLVVFQPAASINRLWGVFEVIKTSCEQKSDFGAQAPAWSCLQWGAVWCIFSLEVSLCRSLLGRENFSRMALMKMTRCLWRLVIVPTWKAVWEQRDRAILKRCFIPSSASTNCRLMCLKELAVQFDFKTVTLEPCLKFLQYVN